MPAPEGRQTRPGLPTEPCPKCKSRRTWAATPEDLDGTQALGCWACGFLLATWRPGQPDWQICAPRDPTLPERVAAARDADARYCDSPPSAPARPAADPPVAGWPPRAA